MCVCCVWGPCRFASQSQAGGIRFMCLELGVCNNNNEQSILYIHSCRAYHHHHIIYLRDEIASNQPQSSN